MPGVGPIELILSLAIAVIWLAVLGLLGYALIVLARKFLHRSNSAKTPPRDPAVEAARVRFARGEIDEYEYERLRSVIRSGWLGPRR
jgi:uncharacterized membrane protein